MMRRLGTILIAGLVGLGACSEQAALEAPAPLGPVTEAEAESWGKRFVGALQTCDVNMLARHFDLLGHIRLALRTTSLVPGLQRAEFEDVSLGNSMRITDLVSCASGQSIVFDGVRGSDEARTVLIGEYDEGVVVSEYHLGTKSDGSVVAQDVFVHNHGQLLSERFGEVMDFVHSDTFNRDQNLEVYGALQSVVPNSLGSLDELTAAARESAAIQRSLLLYATSLGYAAFEKERESFCARRTDCPPMHLFKAFAHTTSEDTVGFAKELLAFSEELGRPEHLHGLAVASAAASGDVKLHASVAEKYLEERPDVDAAWVYAMHARVLSGDLAGATAAMREAGKRFDRVWDEAIWDENEDFHVLKDTPEWKDYEAWRDANFAAEEPAAEEASE